MSLGGGGGGMSEGDDRDTSSCAGRKGLNLKARIGGPRSFPGSGGQRSSNRKIRVNRRSNLLYNGTIWRFDRLFLNNWRPPFEVPWKTAMDVTAWHLAPHKPVFTDIISRVKCIKRHVWANSNEAAHATVDIFVREGETFNIM